MRSETFSTPGQVRLDIEMPAGEIEIATSNTEETHVELESDSANEQVQEMVAAARIESSRRGDVFHVTVEVRTRHGVWISFSGGPDIRLGTPEMRLRIACPAGAELDVKTKSADLEAHGEYSDVDIKTASGDLSIESTRNAQVKTASGDVHFETVSGILDVKSVSGDVHVASVTGDAHFQVVSGDVFVHDAGGSISANSVSGDQRYEAVVNGRVELRAVSGDIGVGIRRGSRVFIDANTVSGSTSSEFELSDAPAAPPSPVADAPPVEDAPLVEVYAKTVSGDVRLERAPAPLNA
jgi:Putative adhesin